MISVVNNTEIKLIDKYMLSNSDIIRHIVDKLKKYIILNNVNKIIYEKKYTIIFENIKREFKNIIYEVGDKNIFIINQKQIHIMIGVFKEDALFEDIEYKVIKLRDVDKAFIEENTDKYIVDDEFIESIKKKRNIFSHKGDFGKVSIYAYKGAGILASSASIKCGSGYTILLSDAETRLANLIKNPECLNYEVEYSHEKDVILLGPNFKNEKYLEKIINDNLEGKMLLDAEAINFLSKNKKIIKKLGKNVILTPHLVEFSRISDFKVDRLFRYPFDCLKSFKIDFRGVILLKGKNTIIYDGNKYYIINIADSRMANAGMGDLLAGMIASYMAQKYSTLNATIYGAYRHSKLASEIAKKKDIVNASDIIKIL